MFSTLLSTAAKGYSYNSAAADSLFSGFGLFFVCLYCGLFILGLVGAAFWIWMLIDLVQRKDTEFGPESSSDKKVIWLLIILFTGWIGGLVYYFVIYKKYPRIK